MPFFVNNSVIVKHVFLHFMDFLNTFNISTIMIQFENHFRFNIQLLKFLF